MQPDRAARREYVEAFREILVRIQSALSRAPRRSLPVRMYVAGGAAMHLYTGERVSEDVDAVFSKRVALPEDLEVTYRDADGAARLLYFDRQYTDTLSPLHEDAHDDAMPLLLAGIDPKVLEVRLLAPVDLAVSKLGRLSDQDRHDIEVLAGRGLIDADGVRRRAEQALAAYVGDLDRVRNSIEIACRVIADARRRGRRPPG